MVGTSNGWVATTAVVVSGLAIVVGAIFALVAGVQQSSGGGTALIGLMVTVPLALLSVVVGIVGAAVAGARGPRIRALLAIGLGLLAPVVFVLLVALLVPTSAFRI